MQQNSPKTPRQDRSFALFIDTLDLLDLVFLENKLLATVHVRELDLRVHQQRSGVLANASPHKDEVRNRKMHVGKRVRNMNWIRQLVAGLQHGTDIERGS